ncbi:ornithine cyclodeaminase family protein [Hathewaya massiliensis]|uniref:ornithine cyclodeaminase family protein n=1 Tax=Hathewaya massiliensis TaxID=1964382 RepID=UPI00115B5D06|nr:ornithine cyclodeaminase family protein [Hathewaya massiliensis]
MLYLNSKDILSAITFEEVMEAIEEAYKLYEKNQYDAPSRIHIDHGDKKTLLFMPCFTENVFGTKILTYFPENPKKGKPVLDGLMLLNDIETGEPICIIDGKALTKVRTGAVGGVGIKNTTPENIKTLGLVGTGVQGFYQVLYACTVRKFEKVYVFHMLKDKAEEFKERLEKELPEVEIIVSDTVEEMVKSSEVIITATTSNKPVLPDDPELLKGKHFIGIGSYKPFMREFPDALSKVVDTVLIDTEFAKEESGDLCIPMESGLLKEDKVLSFGEFLLNCEHKEKVVSGTTLYKSVGMALFDITASRLIYERAKAKGIGQNIEL